MNIKDDLVTFSWEIKDDDSSKWSHSIKDELKPMGDIKVWGLVGLPLEVEWFFVTGYTKLTVMLKERLIDLKQTCRHEVFSGKDID